MQNEDIAALDFSDWPIRDDYLIEIGSVAVLWASCTATDFGSLFVRRRLPNPSDYSEALY